ncbi:MAG: glycosyltransferase family 2 protein [Gemmatimonadota bacterium]
MIDSSREPEATAPPAPTPREPSIAVILLTYDQPDDLFACLDSLLALEQEPPFRLLVWENGTGIDTAGEMARRYPSARYELAGENLGVAGGRNSAARLATELWAPTHLLFLDNDMVVEKGFVRELARAFRDDPALAQAQAKLRMMTEPSILNDGGGCDVRFWLGRTRPVGIGEEDRGQYDSVRPCVAAGGATLTRRAVFEALGGFDTTFNPYGPEDLDFSLRVREAGHESLFVPTAVAYHKYNRTYVGKSYTAAYARGKARNWFRLMRRHASALDWLGFLAIGAPLGLARAGIREIRRGNARAIGGLLRGALDAVWGRVRP